MDLLRNILTVIVSPRYGWELINVAGVPTGRIVYRAFLPLLAVLAVSAFVPMVYDKTITLSMSLMTAIVQFSSFFFSYHIVAYLLGGFYPELVRTKGANARLNDFILYSLIYLVILEIIGNLLPIDFTPIFFMMTYLVWIVYRGSEYLIQDKHRSTRFNIVASAMLLLTPIVITQLLSLLIVR